VPSTQRPAAVVVFSTDLSLRQLAETAVSSPFECIVHPNPYVGRDLVLKANVRVVVLDDESLDDDDRGWLVAQIRRRAPDARLVYVASNHTAANEKRVRANGAHYYTSKPIDSERFLRVVQAFLTAP
jgi:DNA-binding NarL/FixJ family response regulator